MNGVLQLAADAHTSLRVTTQEEEAAKVAVQVEDLALASEGATAGEDEARAEAEEVQAEDTGVARWASGDVPATQRFETLSLPEQDIRNLRMTCIARMRRWECA